jgi:hypothetical protein
VNAAVPELGRPHSRSMSTPLRLPGQRPEVVGAEVDGVEGESFVM